MSDSTAELIQELQENQVATYTGLAVTSIILYDYIITLDQEISFVWRRKFTTTSLLLISTRWAMVINQILLWLPWGEHGCKALYGTSETMQIMAFAQVALFSALRIYAIWHDSRLRHFLLASILVLELMPVWTNIFASSRLVPEYLGSPFNVCVNYLNISNSVNEAVLCGDVIVVVSTLVKTFQQWRESRRLKLKLSASSLLLRDGTVYFILLLALNVAQILTAETPATTLTASATQFITTMPSVLISRFILNLRQLSQTDSTESTADVDRFSRFSVPNFRVPSDLLGNIGEPLDHRQDEAVFLGDSRSESGFASERRVSDESGSSTDHSGRSESENGV